MNAPLASPSIRKTRGGGALRAGRVVRGVVGYLVIGAVISVGIALALGVFLEMSTGVAASAEWFGGQERWSVSTLRRAGGVRIQSSRQREVKNWSPHQATGAPDTAYGDAVTAWASATADGADEWLILDYEKPLSARMIQVHETFNPGAIDRVTVFDEDGREVEVFEGPDTGQQGATDALMAPRVAQAGDAWMSRSGEGGQGPPTAPPGVGRRVAEFPVNVNFKTSKVKVYIGSKRVAGWNEIDAVGIVDDGGKTWWAVGVEASSAWVQGNQPAAQATATTVQDLAPAWTGLNTPSVAYQKKQTQGENRIVEARGWPFLALWCESETGTAAGRPVTATLLTASGTARPVLPLRPIVAGLALNSVCWGIVAAGGMCVLRVPRRFIGEIARMRRGCCIRCGYELGYDFARGCPECGWRRSNDCPPGALMRAGVEEDAAVARKEPKGRSEGRLRNPA